MLGRILDSPVIGTNVKAHSFLEKSTQSALQHPHVFVTWTYSAVVSKQIELHFLPKTQIGSLEIVFKIKQIVIMYCRFFDFALENNKKIRLSEDMGIGTFYNKNYGVNRYLWDDVLTQLLIFARVIITLRFSSRIYHC